MSTPSYWPTLRWEASAPEEQGLESRRIVQVLDAIRTRIPRLHSLLIVRNGYLVTEAYFYPFGPGWRHGVASCSKAVMSSLVGVAIQQGYLKSLQQRMVDFFPGRHIANRDARKEAITIEQLMTMSSGLHGIYTDTEVTLYDMRASSDWVQFMLDQPMDDEPGTCFTYSSGASHIVSAILTQATGRPMLELAREYLFGPLGIRDVVWPSDPQGYTRGWGHLQLQPQDMARFGYLFLNDGMWEGRRLLPPGWVTESTRLHFDPWPRGHGYGLLWWLQCASSKPGARDEPAEGALGSPLQAQGHGFGPVQWYFAAGIGVQLIAVHPGTRLVCVTTGSTDQEDRDTLFQILEEHVVGSARTSALPKDLKAERLLQSEVAGAAVPHPKPLSPLPALARSLSGRTIVFETNPLGWNTLLLTFAAGSDVAQISYNDCAPVVVGLDGVPRLTAEADRTQRSTWQGWWEDDSLVLEQDTLSQYRRYRLRLTFRGDEVAVSSHESANGTNHEFKGRVASQ
jgi:CubicO group peptidase (beta-lactamase class C family)